MASGILDAHLDGALALLVGVHHEARLHLPAYAAQRRGREYALGRAAYAHVEVDARFVGVGRVDDARDVAVADQADRGAGRADLVDERGVARPVEDTAA